MKLAQIGSSIPDISLKTDLQQAGRALPQRGKCWQSPRMGVSVFKEISGIEEPI